CANHEADGETIVTSRRNCLLIWFVLAARPFTLAQTPAVTSPTREEIREKAVKFPEIVEALSISAGSRVADIGAGEGFFTTRIAKRVGSTGRIYAVDIDDKFAVPKLRELVEKQSLANVSVIHSEPADPKLPPGSLDAALMVIVYHEVE